MASRTSPLREYLAAARAKAPFVGTIVRDINCGAFARTLGALLSGGAPAVVAIDLAANAAPNNLWRQRFRSVGQSLRDGRTVAAALSSLPAASPRTCSPCPRRRNLRRPWRDAGARRQHHSRTRLAPSRSGRSGSRTASHSGDGWFHRLAHERIPRRPVPTWRGHVLMHAQQRDAGFTLVEALAALAISAIAAAGLMSALGSASLRSAEAEIRKRCPGSGACGTR